MGKKDWVGVGKVICCICGKLILKASEMSKEHEPPLSRGGTKDGWKWAHKKCNNKKGSLTMDEYRAWLLLEAKRHGNQK